MLEYKQELERIDPSVEWLMTLYLHPEVTPEEIKKAAAAGIRGESSPVLRPTRPLCPPTPFFPTFC